MKAILYIVAILVAGGAAFFSFDQKNKFEALDADRLATIHKNVEVTAQADADDKAIAKLEETKKSTEEKKELITQSVSSLKSQTNSLTNDVARLEDELKVQDQQFADYEKAMVAVNETLTKIGGNVTLETLPAKIQEIEEDKKAKQTKLDELLTVTASTEKTLAATRAELDRLNKRMIDRSSRIGRNSMEAVVTAVNQEWGFLVIGAGSNSGFTPQTSLLVKRDGKTIGRVRPSAIEPTQTIAEIDMDSLSPGVRLQPGDRVILSKPTTN